MRSRQGPYSKLPLTHTSEMLSHTGLKCSHTHTTETLSHRLLKCTQTEVKHNIVNTCLAVVLPIAEALTHHAEMLSYQPN